MKAVPMALAAALGSGGTPAAEPPVAQPGVHDRDERPDAAEDEAQGERLDAVGADVRVERRDWRQEDVPDGQREGDPGAVPGQAPASSASRRVRLVVMLSRPEAIGVQAEEHEQAGQPDPDQDAQLVFEIHARQPSDVRNTARKASCGISTLPIRFMRAFPSFCFSSSLRFRVMSPP